MASGWISGGWGRAIQQPTKATQAFSAGIRARRSANAFADILQPTTLCVHFVKHQNAGDR